MKKKGLLCILLATTAVAAIGALAAGCGQAEASVDWNISDAAITVEGYRTAPQSVEPGTELSFSISCATGYGNAEVTFDGQSVQPAGGIYTVRVENDAEIVISAEKIESVSCTLENSEFYVGDVITDGDVDVKAKYESGTEVSVTDFTVEYASGMELSFGDTAFAVEYNGVSSSSVAIPAVKGKIVISAGYATIADSYKAYLEGLGLTVLQDAEKNTYTIPYSELTDDISLPIGEYIADISGGYIFRAWNIAGSTATKVSGGIRENIYVYPQFTLDAVAFTSVSIALAEEMPVLTVEGEYLLDVSSLQLTIGSGEGVLESQAVSGRAGDTFRIDYDLTNISANDSWKYSWLDLALTCDGNRIDIDLNEAGSIVDMEQSVISGEFLYQFEQWEGLLKVTFTDASEVAPSEAVTSFTIAVQNKGAGANASVTFTGKINAEAYFGKTVCIDTQNNSDWGTKYWYTEIDGEGNWSLTLDLTEENGFIGNTIYMHFAVVEPDDHSAVLFKDGQYGNIANDWCVNEDFVAMSGVSDITSGLSCEDDVYTYYIGLGWDGIKMFIAAK